MTLDIILDIYYLILSKNFYRATVIMLHQSMIVINKNRCESKFQGESVRKGARDHTETAYTEEMSPVKDEFCGDLKARTIFQSELLPEKSSKF